MNVNKYYLCLTQINLIAWFYLLHPVNFRYIALQMDGPGNRYVGYIESNSPKN